MWCLAMPACPSSNLKGVSSAVVTVASKHTASTSKLRTIHPPLVRGNLRFPWIGKADSGATLIWEPVPPTKPMAVESEHDARLSLAEAA